MVSNGVDEMKRVRNVLINWSWGRAMYVLRIDGQDIRIFLPSWSDQARERLFQFDWKNETYSASLSDETHGIAFCRGTDIAAVLQPTFEYQDNLRRVQFCNRPHTKEVAHLDMRQLQMTLKCQTTCIGSALNHRVTDDQGRCICYWRKLKGFQWGKGGVELLLPTSTPYDLVPILLCTVVSTLVDISG